MKKLFVILVSFAMFAGCHVPSGQYRLVRVSVHSTHGGHWHEVSPGYYRPSRKVVVVKKRRRKGRRSARTRDHRQNNRRRDHDRRNFY